MENKNLDKYELDQKLRQDIMDSHPLLYADRNKDLRSTCIVYGLDVGPGWLNLINKLSDDLEQEIKNFLKENEGKILCECGCSFEDHTYGCKSSWHIPIFSIPQANSWVVPKNPILKFLKQLKYTLKGWLNRKLYWLSKNTFLHRTIHCKCLRYRPYFPRASQVKSKFASLRFYMTAETEKMHSLIEQAMRESTTTCEECGNKGRQRSCSGWFIVSCDECMLKHPEDIEDCADLEDEQEIQ